MDSGILYRQAVEYASVLTTNPADSAEFTEFVELKTKELRHTTIADPELVLAGIAIGNDFSRIRATVKERKQNLSQTQGGSAQPYFCGTGGLTNGSADCVGWKKRTPAAMVGIPTEERTDRTVAVSMKVKRRHAPETGGRESIRKRKWDGSITLRTVVKSRLQTKEANCTEEGILHEKAGRIRSLVR
jgi:hypothetical protein